MKDFAILRSSVRLAGCKNTSIWATIFEHSVYHFLGLPRETSCQACVFYCNVPCIQCHKTVSRKKASRIIFEHSRSLARMLFLVVSGLPQEASSQQCVLHANVSCIKFHRRFGDEMLREPPNDHFLDSARCIIFGRVRLVPESLLQWICFL